LDSLGIKKFFRGKQLKVQIEKDKRRLTALRYLKKGRKLTAIAKELKCSVNTVHRWKQAYEKEGIFWEKHAGRPSKLSAENKAWLLIYMLKGPKKWGYEGKDWTARTLSDLIFRATAGKVTFHRNSIWALRRNLMKELRDGRLEKAFEKIIKDEFQEIPPKLLADLAGINKR